MPGILSSDLKQGLQTMSRKAAAALEKVYHRQKATPRSASMASEQRMDAAASYFWKSIESKVLGGCG